MLSTRRNMRGERGQVVVFFALLIPVLFAIAAIVMDVGNWYVHKRHLQTQVDAAALAAGPQFVGCFSDPAAANLSIASRALAYAGDTLRLGKLGPGAPDSTTNLQLQEPDDVRVALNSRDYWQQSDGNVPGTDGYGLDHTLDSADTDTFGDPCNERYLDVKATDDEAPPLWGLIPLTPSPKSHAKVEIHDIISARGMLPWAVPEIDPAAVVALFVDEDPTGAEPEVFKTQDLVEIGSGSFPWSMWRTSAGQENIILDGGHENTGVVILVSKNDTTPTLSGDLSDTCTQDPGLVACYGNPTTLTSGLSFIHAYNGGDTGDLQTPIVRGVELVDVGCPVGDDSAPYFTLSGGCSAGISAVVDFGVTGTTDPGDWPNCVTVNSSPGGTMTWVANVVGGSLFTQSMSLATASGRNEVDLSWESEDRPGGPDNCNQTRWSGSFNKVAAPYVANTASGPVQYLDLDATHPSTGISLGDPNSVERNSGGNSYNYVVTVGLPKPLQIGNYLDDPLLLRMASPSGSQNQAWDCDTGRNFREEIETGCLTTYTENYRDDDGDGTYLWNNILCAGWGTTNLPPPTIGPGPSPYPSDCVITETGDKTGQLRDGLHDRLETPCYENNWPNDAVELADFLGPDGQSYASDPRYVTLIITDNTAFTGSGNEPLPIKYFAGFYVTGWDYHPTQSPGCPDTDGLGPYQGNDDHPIFGPVGSYPHSQDNGDVWGYFVDIVVFSGAGDPSDNLCTFGGDPAACVAVLVE